MESERRTPRKRTREEISGSEELVSDRDAHKTCYVIEPKNKRSRNRPRRCPFIPLNDSVPEDPAHVNGRWTTYTALMPKIHSRISSILENSDKKTVDKVINFVLQTPVYEEDEYTQLPVGLILAGVNISDHNRLFSNLTSKIEDSQDGRISTVNVTSRDVSNAREFTKKIISETMKLQPTVDDAADEITAPIGSSSAAAAAGRATTGSESSDKRLSFDLGRLVDWYKTQPNLEKIVVVVQDADGLDNNLLPEAIRILHVYRKQLPFVLLLGIATTLPIFNTKIPKFTMRLIDIECFDVLQSEHSLTQFIDDVLLAEDMPVVLGPRVFRAVVKRYLNNTKDMDKFISAVQYAVMAHFFANPLSVLIDTPLNISKSDPHMLALRSLPSFRNYINKNVKELQDESPSAKTTEDINHNRTRINSVRHILTDSLELFRFFEDQRTTLFEKLRRKLEVMKILAILQDVNEIFTSTNVKRGRAELYSDVLSGKLRDSAFLEELLEITTRMSADTVEKLARMIDETFGDGSSVRRMKEHWNIADFSGNSQHGLLLENISISLREFIYENLEPLSQIPFSEVFIFDAPSLYQNVFTPLYRETIEKALRQPSFYLGEPDDPEEGVAALEKPVVCTGYSLYKESGSLINTYDFWTAFHQTIAGEHNQDAEERDTDEVLPALEGEEAEQLQEDIRSFSKAQTVAWFYKAVNELRYLGFIRDSTSRKGPVSKNAVGVLQKLAWDGL